jgi:hypothetical protein
MTPPRLYPVKEPRYPLIRGWPVTGDGPDDLKNKKFLAPELDIGYKKGTSRERNHISNAKISFDIVRIAKYIGAGHSFLATVVQGDSFGTRPKKMRISQRLFIRF